ncbi:MAG: SufBD protein [Candidatus Collierbacteria bacterium GW2011_GWB1_44_6]|uniref:SufBD protein n=2 Tax=Candidatus Collieribacteriota TaxID=1752725 RepID=A0A0G1JN65_9BACT|nr:MAG: SufBD protein [Candidatus Collierbacteria bacterium GW2011_GWC2_43_12]KKT72991.1 MAG: SufBD protein [Candidatus Collierbacteria bacterium GW2011_GWB1_44_6]
MKIQRFRLDKPGEIDLVVPFSTSHDEKEVLGVISAMEPGDYRVRVVADHKAPNTFGRVVIKGVAANGAHVSIDGMVKIGKEARNTDSFLEMRVLLLDKKSSAVAEPKLEIENNDVKASHAATVGKIDEDQLFYLSSRGVDLDEANKLIINGFLKEVNE